MKKWMFPVTKGNIALILTGTVINLIGRWIAIKLFLPVWLDCVGTFISAVLLGPVAGAISGGFTNIAVNFVQPGQIWYAIVSIAGGVAVGSIFPRDRKINAFPLSQLRCLPVLSLQSYPHRLICISITDTQVMPGEMP